METPKPVEPSMFPTWPAKSEQMRQKKAAGSGGGSPKAPAGGMDYDKLLVGDCCGAEWVLLYPGCPISDVYPCPG